MNDRGFVQSIIHSFRA
jgi:hypothetical protein